MPTTPSIPDAERERSQLGFVAVLAGLVLASSLAGIYLVWASARSDQRQDVQAEFDYRVRDAETRLSQRMLAYEEVLRGLAGLFASSERVLRSEFRDYVAALQLKESYPGVLAAGFALAVSDAEKARHIASIRREGFPGYTIHPEGQRAQYSPNVFLEPLADRTLLAVGYDMWSEPIRRAAMERSRDSGASSVSAKVTLFQDQDGGGPGFVMYLPVYRNGSPHGTVAERRANIFGWVVLPFRMRDLMLGVFGERGSELDIDLYDGATISASALMYNSAGAVEGPFEPGGRQRAVRHLIIAGREWTVVVHSLINLGSIGPHKPRMVALVGCAASVLLTLLVLLLVSGRTRALRAARRMNRDLIRTQGALRESTSAALKSQEQLARVIAGSDDGYLDWDIRTGGVASSARFAEMLGLAPEQVEPGFAGLVARVHCEDVEALRTAIEAHLSGRTAQLDVHARVRAGDGRWRWLRARGKVAERDAQGQPTRVTGTISDVDLQRRAEQALQESEQRFRAMANSAPVMIWMCGEDGRCTWLNQVCLDFAGRTMEEELDAGWTDKIHPDDRQRCHDVVAGAIQRRRAFAQEFRLRRFDGEYRWLMDSGTPRTDEQGAFAGFIGSCIDITDRKRLEEDRELLMEEAWTATHRRERMLAVVAHDLRSPLAAVGLAAHALERFCSDPALRESFGERLEIIRLSSERMGRLIEDLLDVASIQSGRLRLSAAPNDPAAIARDAVRVVAQEARRRGIRLELQILGAPPTADCDRGRVAQVLGNLLSNAFQATGAGGSVTLSVGEREDRVVFSVLDTGRGLPAGSAERLFEPYERGPDPRYKGAGLGLAIAKGIVDEHGGRIWAENNQGAGAAFRFAIPKAGSPKSTPRGGANPGALAA